MERSNFLKHRDQLITQSGKPQQYLGQTFQYGPDPYEILSIRLVSTPVQFESVLNQKTYRVSISHSKETDDREVLAKFLENAVD